MRRILRERGWKQFISLKWKLSLALVCLSMGLVGLYVFVAKQVFESDKIAYVFESQQAQLESLSKVIQQKVERILFDSRAILFSYDFESKNLGSSARGFFATQRSIHAIQAVSPATNEVVALLEKEPGAGAAFGSPSAGVGSSGQISLAAHGPSRFLIASPSEVGSQNRLVLRVLAEIPDLLPQVSGSRTVMLAKGEQILAASKGAEIFQELLADLSRDRATGMTGVRTLNGNRYLVSVSPLAISDLKILLIEPESIALSAVGVLYRRSLAFIAFSVFMTVILSLGLSLGLTRKLNTLTTSASRIGQGDFSAPPRIDSGDEVGVLGRAFARMSQEIQKLLIETKEKTRMEEELKTASLVQESLFPNPSTFEKNGFLATGLYSTSSECGGDWWYYFESKNALYVMVGDVTGHGTPAALITSAARSIFSGIERRSHLSLLEIAKDWEIAVTACAGGERFMTALLLQIDMTTGRGTLVNASHELPMLFRHESEGEFINAPSGPTLGEGRHDWTEHPVALMPGDRLLIFTDGMWAVESPEKKTFGERSFLKKLTRLSTESNTGPVFLNGVHQLLENHRKGQPLPDDVTLVLVERKIS
jgi:sigma-B regulation protein RsbU (phosphoserine phosphatase)